MRVINKKNQFVRGFLLQPKSAEIKLELSGWLKKSFGTHNLLLHPQTEVRSLIDGDRSLHVIGRAYDVNRRELSRDQIVDKLMAVFVEGGQAELIAYAAWLFGRYIVIAENHEGLCIIPDCAATYACHYLQNDDRGVFASGHWSLLAEASGAKPNEVALSFMTSPEYFSPGGKYYPGLWTPYNRVRTLIANHFLQANRNSETVEQKRFYPTNPLLTRSALDVQEQFEDRLSQCLALSVETTTMISLTAGGDSLSTLSAYVRSGLQHDSRLSAFTYIKTQSPVYAQFEDAFGASKYSRNVGLPHLVFGVDPVDFDSEFHKWYTKSFPRGARYPSLARAYYENLPLDCTILISTVAEIGTTFYRERSSGNPSAENLASKFTTSAASKNPSLLSCMAEYIECTSFKPEKFFGFDWHDLFYWEHRNSKWASLWYSEVDMSGFAIVPYNDRRLIELMLSLPLSERTSRTLQNNMIKRWLSET